jgi:4-amino-4-deoxy-L-arabinose transferase-like glycosyltransferase
MAAGNTRRVLIAAAGLALAARLAFAFGYWNDQPLTRDEREYLSLARSLAAGQGFEYDADVASGPVQPFGRAPGYPAFLALVGGGGPVASAVPAAVKIAQACTGALGVILLGVIAGRLAGDRAARAAALLAAVYPPLVWISAYAFSEALFWPMGLAAALALDAALGRSDRDVGWAAIAGVLSGVAVLVRPAMLLFVVPAGAWILLGRRRVAAALLFAAGVTVIVAPWTARNYAKEGRFVLVASEGGVTFWTGNHPRARGEGDLAANPDLKREALALRAEHPDLTEEQMEPLYYREALGWMRADPVAWLALEARKLFYLIVPIGPSYTLHSRLYLVSSIVSYLLVLSVAIVGLIRLGGRVARVPGLWLLVGSAVLTSLVFFPQERFRIPIIDPALIVLAGAALAFQEDGRPA